MKFKLFCVADVWDCKLIFDYLIADQPSHHFQSLMTYSETTFQKAFKNRYKKIPKRRNSNIKLLHNIYLKKK